MGVPHAPAWEEIGKMCDTPITTWFREQHASNPYTTEKAGEFEWTRINTIMSNLNTDKGQSASDADKNTIKQWYIDRLSDEYLRGRMKEHKYTDLTTFKTDISKGRGSTVTCHTKPTWLIKNETLKGDELQQYNEFKCGDSGTFGPDNIISKEYEEWSSDTMANPQNQYKSDKGDFKIWGEGLMPPNHKFEKCINTLLDENTNEFDLRMIKQIHKKGKKHKSIFALNDNEISFIERKLQMLVADSSTEGVLDCIRKNMLLDKSICNAGLSEQMNFVLNVLFSIIGYQFKLDELNVKNANNKEKMIKIIDKLGDLIPRALKKIIDISKKLEIEKGCISQNTEVLEELYSKIFTSGKNVINFDMGLSKMISEASPKAFDRTTILMVLGIAFLKYF